MQGHLQEYKRKRKGNKEQEHDGDYISKETRKNVANEIKRTHFSLGHDGSCKIGS